MQENRPDLSTTDRMSSGTTLLDILLVLVRNKALVLGLPPLLAVVAFAASFFMPNVYTGTAKIMPPQQNQSNAIAILGQLGVTGGLAQSALGVKSPSDIFVSMLKSRSVADALIEKFKLKEVYSEDYLVDARKKLAKRSSINVAKDGVITIEVEDSDPQRAAALANAYIEELEKLTLRLAVSEASQRRLFFEKQVRAARDSLSQAEVELKRFKEASGLVAPEGQAHMTVAMAASIRAQITAKEVQIASLRSFATDSNPEVLRAEKELGGLRSQLSRLEQQARDGKGDVLVSLGKAPENSLEFLQRVRDVKYNEVLFELLAKQHEIARVDEAKNATLIQVVDAALVPEKKSSPRHLLLAAITALLGFFLSVFVAFFREAYAAARLDPRRAGKLAALESLLRGRPAR